MRYKDTDPEEQRQHAGSTDYEKFEDDLPVTKGVSFRVEQKEYVLEKTQERDAEENMSVVSTVASAMTADGIADPTSFQINCFVVFLSDMARGVFFPCMWELVQTLGGDQILLGYVIASFSFGRMLVLPLFGKWSIIHGYRWTLLMSVSILLVGCILFGLVLTVRTAWFMLFSNAVIGVGSGTLGVTVAYASDVTPKRKRTSYMAWVTAVQYAGTTATPFLGSLFIVLFKHAEEADDERGLPEINEFTAPALFMALMSCLALFLIYFYFNDIDTDRNKTLKHAVKKLAMDDYANEPICCGFMTIYTGAMIACMALNGLTKGPMSCFETLGIDFAETRFNMFRAEAGSIVATMGLIGSINLILMRLSFNKYSDASMICGGILIFIVGIAMNLALDNDQPENNARWKFALSMFFSYAVGYPICHTALVGMFSKIVGRRPQGTLQGIFSASGSIARVSFPISAGYIVKGKDIETLFSLLSIILLGAALFVFSYRKAFDRMAA